MRVTGGVNLPYATTDREGCRQLSRTGEIDCLNYNADGFTGLHSMRRMWSSVKAFGGAGLSLEIRALRR